MEHLPIALPSEQTVTKFPPTSAFVANHIRITADLPFNLAPGCVIRKADRRQIELIKERLSNGLAPSMISRMISRYECDEKITQLDGGNTQSEAITLQHSDFRYYMVDTPDSIHTSMLLHHAAGICQIRLDLVSLSFYGQYAEGGWGHHPLALLNYAFYGGEAPKEVDLSALQEIGTVFRLLQSATEDTGTGERYPKAKKAVEMLDQVRLLPQHSSFRVLGLFSILELLISHNPTLADKGDSITHQMKTKMPLIMRRFDRGIELASFFGSCATEKIWAQMYGYRSAIAHGGNPDFTSNQKQGLLKSSDNANKFLEAVTIATIRNYLREPDLYDDLSGV